MILFITSWWKPLSSAQCPLTEIVYMFPLQNQTTDLANSLADSIIYRSSCSQMFFKISVLKNFANFTGTHLCWSLFLTKVSSGLKACNFIKKKLQHSCFTEKFAKYSSTTFFTEHLRWGITRQPDKLQLKTYYYGSSHFYLKKIKVYHT